MREVINYVFSALSMVLLGRPLGDMDKAGKACNECKTLGRLELECVKILGHESSFPNRRFLFPVVINNRRSSAINSKT